MMYNFIVNPETNRKCNIHNTLGHKILVKYIKQYNIQNGGTYNELNLKKLIKEQIKSTRTIHRKKCLENKHKTGYTWNPKKTECSYQFQNVVCKLKKIKKRNCNKFMSKIKHKH